MHSFAKITLIILIINLLVVRRIAAQAGDDIKIEFTETDSSYSFNGTLKLKAEPLCLLQICFQEQHIRALATEAKEVKLIKKGTNWNWLEYTYLKLIYFENKSVWYRVLHEQELRVDFYLLSSKNNHEIMPRMLSSSGYYQMKPMGEYTQVEYHQECVLSKEAITKLQIKIVKEGAIRFMHRFKEYAVKMCN